MDVNWDENIKKKKVHNYKFNYRTPNQEKLTRLSKNENPMNRK